MWSRVTGLPEADSEGVELDDFSSRVHGTSFLAAAHLRCRSNRMLVRIFVRGASSLALHGIIYIMLVVAVFASLKSMGPLRDAADEWRTGPSSVDMPLLPPSSPRSSPPVPVSKPLAPFVSPPPALLPRSVPTPSLPSSPPPSPSPTTPLPISPSTPPAPWTPPPPLAPLPLTPTRTLLSRMRRLRLTDGQLWNGNAASREYWADKCIDGSVVSGCLSAVYKEPPEKWFSARISDARDRAQPPLVSRVAIYLYKPWGGMRLAPFEVWLSSVPGAVAPTAIAEGDTAAVRGDAALCAGPVMDEPPHDGSAVVLECGASAIAAQRMLGLAHVTVRHIGPARGFFLSELVAYELHVEPAPASPPSTTTTTHATVQALNSRWRQGVPANATRHAGVLVHMFDSYEDWGHGRPWAVAAGSGFDHLSFSMVNAARPAVYPSADGAGIALAADVPILCAYPGDWGTGSDPNGACDKHDAAFTSLHAAMTAQPQNGWSFNEVIVGSLDWAEGLPELIKAIVLTKLDNVEGLEQARSFRAAFARRYAINLTVVSYNPFHGFNLTDV